MGKSRNKANAYLKKKKKGSLRAIASRLVSKDWNRAQRLFLKLLWARRKK